MRVFLTLGITLYSQHLHHMEVGKQRRPRRPGQAKPRQRRRHDSLAGLGPRIGRCPVHVVGTATRHPR